MTGTFVAVVGPSGAGKDSLISEAKQAFAADEVLFVRRVVTREADSGSEDHDSLGDEAFAAAEAAGQFALSWEAHGLRYGLPLSLEDDLAAGRVVVANLSRAVIPQLVRLYPSAVIVEVTADADIIAARLAGRARETGEAIRRRLDRSVPVTLPASTVRIDNSGALDIAVAQFVGLLGDLRRSPVKA